MNNLKEYYQKIIDRVDISIILLIVSSLFVPLLFGVQTIMSEMIFFIILILFCFFYLRDLRNRVFDVSYLIFYALLLFKIILIPFAISPYRTMLMIGDLLFFAIFFLLWQKDDKKSIFFPLIYIFTFINLLFTIYYFLSGNKFLFFTCTIHQGAFIGLTLVLTLYFFKEINKIIFYFILFLNLFALILASSKAATLGVIFIFILLYHKKIKKIYVILGILILLIVPNPVRAIFVKTIKTDKYAFNRLNIWQSSLRAIKYSPFLGYGADGLRYVSRRYNFPQDDGISRYHKRALFPHNEYLARALEGGILELFFYFLLLVIFFQREFQSKERSVQFYAMLFLLTQFFLFNFFENIFFKFFFFILIFSNKILKDQDHFYLEKRKRYFIMLFSGILFLLVAVLPILSNKNNNDFFKFKREKYLQRAIKLMPLNSNNYYIYCQYLIQKLKKDFKLNSYLNLWDLLEKAQKYEKYSSRFKLLELEAYTLILKHKGLYKGFKEDINKLEDELLELFPYNPFIRYGLAEIYLIIQEEERAKSLLLESVKLEPFFKKALVSLKDNFNYFKGKEDKFQELMAVIEERKSKYKPKKGSYLFLLWSSK